MRLLEVFTSSCRKALDLKPINLMIKNVTYCIMVICSNCGHQDNVLCVKGGPWIKKVQKVGKSKPRFLIQKNHQFISAALFEFLMSQIFHKKIGWLQCSKYDQNDNKCKKGWRRIRWATILSRMKIWTMPRKKAQNSVAQRDQLQGEI